jgi:hypothetical protein
MENFGYYKQGVKDEPGWKEERKEREEKGRRKKVA